MRNQRPVLVVRPQPLRSAHKEVLLHHGPLSRSLPLGAVGIRRGAAGAHVSAARRLDPPVPASASTSPPCPVRPGSTPAAESGPPSCGRTRSPATCRSGCRSAPWPADRRPCKPRTREAALAGPLAVPAAMKRRIPAAAVSSAAARPNPAPRRALPRTHTA